MCEILITSIPSGESVDTADAQGMTPLLYACKNGQMRLAKYLLKERRPSAKVKSAQGWTGLHFLALSALGGAQQGARGPKATNNREKKAKDRMSSQDRLEVAELLLANGCDVNAKAAGVSAFYAACMEGDRELVRLCIDHGAQVNAVGEADDRPRAEEMQEGGEVGLDDMNVEEWTDDDEGGAWDDQLNTSNSSAMDEEQQEQPQRASPASESHFKGREDVAVRSASAGGKRSRSKSYRERVNIFQRDREEEAIGESGTHHLHRAVRVVS
jgi:ankyrin repeat protein